MNQFEQNELTRLFAEYRKYISDLKSFAFMMLLLNIVKTIVIIILVLKQCF